MKDLFRLVTKALGIIEGSSPEFWGVSDCSDCSEADGPSYSEKAAMLAECVGTISHLALEHAKTAVLYGRSNLTAMPPHREEHYRQKLRTELLVLAAYCIGWVEALDKSTLAVQPPMERRNAVPVDQDCE